MVKELQKALKIVFFIDSKLVEAYKKGRDGFECFKNTCNILKKMFFLN